MKNGIKELTEGMQRLCAIANRIVAHGDEVSPIERDLLLEDLRRLYEVALRLDAGEKEEARGLKEEVRGVRPEVKMPDDEILSSTVMATMAAMAPAVEPEPELVVEPEPMIEPESDTLLSQPQAAASSPNLGEQQDSEVPAADSEATVSSSSPELGEGDRREAVVEESVKVDEVPVEGDEVPVKVDETSVEAQSLPAMEELEANGNSLLFDEVIIGEPEHPAPGTQASLLDYLQHTPQSHRDSAPNLGEQLKPTVRTLGETLGEQSAASNQPSILSHEKKVSDLRTVININDKFSFMSELFRNNMKAYNDFILRLNAIDTRDEALMCVNEVSAQYKWDESSLAVQAFYKVFDKKF